MNKDERQAEKEQDLVKANGPPKTSNEKKFSSEDLLPTGGGSHSIQEILADITQVACFFILKLFTQSENIFRVRARLYLSLFHLFAANSKNI